MSIIRQTTTVPTVGQVTLDLSPFDRFGGRGGRVSVKATVLAAEALANMTMTVLVGSDVLINAGQIPSEPTPNSGPTAETPAVTGRGAPADPITVTFFNASLAGVDVRSDIEVENA